MDAGGSVVGFYSGSRDHTARCVGNSSQDGAARVRLGTQRKLTQQWDGKKHPPYFVCAHTPPLQKVECILSLCSGGVNFSRTFSFGWLDIITTDYENAQRNSQ